MGTPLNVAQEATDRKNYYLISSDVLRLNYTIMNHRNFVDNFWIGIWYDGTIKMKARLLKKLRKESKKLKLIRGEDYYLTKM